MGFWSSITAPIRSVAQAVVAPVASIAQSVGILPSAPSSGFPLGDAVVNAVSKATQAANNPVNTGQQAAAAVASPTSTMLTGTTGVKEDPNNTSKILLGQ